MVENDASKVYEASLSAADKRAAEIVRPALVQASDSVPPKSLARGMAFPKLQSRILSASEAVQDAKVHYDMPPEHHAQCRRTWFWHMWDGHAQITDRTGMRNGGWPRRYGSVQRRMQARAPRVLCAKVNGGVLCGQSLVTHPFHPFCCKYGEDRARPHCAVQCTLRRLIEQAGATQTWSAMSLSFTTG